MPVLDRPLFALGLTLRPLAFPLAPGSEAARPRLKNVCRSGDSAEFLAAQAPRVECPPQ